LNSDYKPSFAGERRNTIQSIGRAVDFAQKAGIAAGSVFVIISSLIIFNTIRMAIFNRREEIQMMKLIGANQAFIRGPFLVEASIYGLIAAILASGIGAWALLSSASLLSSYQITVQPTIDLMISRAPLFIVGMIIIGSIIGIISSLFATYRHLKV
jgi:cell division transport system permease protein